MESTILDNDVQHERTSVRLESPDCRTRERAALAQGLSLDALARKAGVSRSMISVIERGESSPTAVVLEKLAGGLGVPLASLFDRPAPRENGERSGAHRKDQPQWQDPESGYRRATSHHPVCRSRCRSSRCIFHRASAWHSKSAAREIRIYQQIWVLEGAIDITVGEDCHRLREGDCLAMQLDGPTMFHNPTREPARYAVVIVSEPPARKR